MYCASCGAQLEDDAQFCVHCGMVIEGDTALDAEQNHGAPVYPPVPEQPIGSATQPGDHAAGQLHAQLGNQSGQSDYQRSNTANTSQSSHSLPRNAKIGIGIGSAVVVLAIIVTIVLVFALPNQAEETADEPTDVQALIVDSTDSDETAAAQDSTQSYAEGTEQTDTYDSSSSGGGGDSYTSSSRNGYTTYSNARFGYCVDYPSYFIVSEAYNDGSGAMFVNNSAGDIIIDLWGSNNSTGGTATSRLTTLVNAVGIEGYTAHGDTWFVYSYEEPDDERIVYIKEYVGAGSINRMSISYPSSMSSTGDAIVEAMESTLEAGDIASTH